MKRDRCTVVMCDTLIVMCVCTTVSFHVRRSLFIYVGLFSYIYVSFVDSIMLLQVLEAARIVPN